MELTFFLIIEPWKVTLVDTGDNDIAASIAFHRSHGKAATLTTTYPPGLFGALDIQEGQVRNREWAWGYREDEAMGGHDPYSSCKGCAELVSSAYRKSFLKDAGIAMATPRNCTNKARSLPKAGTLAPVTKTPAPCNGSLSNCAKPGGEC